MSTMSSRSIHLQFKMVYLLVCEGQNDAKALSSAIKQKRYVQLMALQYKNANITHHNLKATFWLQVLVVRKNPQSPTYTQLRVSIKGTVINVNVSELGMDTTGGNVVCGKYTQITNNPENDGCINAVL
ncbi:hypothetical protein BDR06DRAFT_1068946, partial [Suillus hirtellus]